ncbi:hypothetical protein ACFOED_03800 [Vulcaniibacterium thermophilum]|uniref:Lipoprotein n=1 Tax=Vulcaniibacterium thermophilum TaxID=1169913 RepID=A0A919DDT1_9GAMM|nr:hypothetical protein [Vulcaniibacterium thermophilum]GHE37436.1 hypothetical protein GCM10007167_19500 [Vulcaniibacterium thermophilum]
MSPPRSNRSGRFAPIAAAVFLALAACAPPPPPPPQANPAPRHIVRIHGKAPAHLRLEWFAIYEARHWSETCRTRDTWSNLTWRVPMEVSRNGNRYEALLSVDKFLPGECGWRFAEARLLVAHPRWPDDAVSPNVHSVDGGALAGESPASRCGSDPVCVERAQVLYDSKPTPVEINCRVKRAERAPREEYFTCQELLREVRKLGQSLRPETRVVEVNINDRTDMGRGG